MLRRNRFGDLITRQLQVFAADEAERLERIRALRDLYTRSTAEDAEELYGEYADEVDWAAEELEALRDGYAATLDEEIADRYRREFARAVAKAMPEIAAALGDCGDSGGNSSRAAKMSAPRCYLHIPDLA